MFILKQKGGEKLRVQLEFEMSTLPIGYRLGMLSIIKEMVRAGSEDYYQNIFQINKRKIKPFSYSTYIQGLTINHNEVYGNKLHLTISSPSYEFIMYLVNGSQRLKTYQYKDYKLMLKHKRLLPKPPKFSEVVTFTTASPILIENNLGKPLLATDPAFEKEFNYYANIIANEIYQRELFKPLQIIQSVMKKTVLKENLHQDEEQHIYITANQGQLTLKGHSEDLKMLYECGVGRRRSLGLGLLNVKEVAYY